MHRSDHNIQLSKKLGGHIQTPIGANINLYATEDMDALNFLVELFDFCYLLPHSLGIQPVSDSPPHRVLSNTQILIAKGSSSQSHGFNTVTPVAPVGMNMEVALDIRQLYQPGYSALLRPYYLLSTLSYLRGDKLQTLPLIKSLLGGKLLQLPGFQIGDAILR